MCVDSSHHPLKRAHNSFEEFAKRENPRSASPYYQPEIYDDKTFRLELPCPRQNTTSTSDCISSSALEASLEIQSPSRPLKKAKISNHGDISQKTSKEEKAQKEKEREAERERKEAERETKRLAHEAEKQAREEKRQKAEEARKKKEEERLKKERSQMKLGSFFVRPPLVERTQGSNLDIRKGNLNVSQNINASSTSTYSEKSPYQVLFPEFFVQTGVTLAPTSWYKGDKDLHRKIEETIDGYIAGTYVLEKPATIREILNTPKDETLPRGKLYSSTSDLMEEFYLGKSDRSRDLILPPSASHAQRSSNLLLRIPVKSLKFQEDVRPPYIGTFTSRPICGTAKLAKNPLRRALPNINYDYDSEAEWVEDEDGEDLRSSDEDEDVDDDEDMNGFLDDDDDDDIASRSNKMALKGDLQPISTGICWETKEKQDQNIHMSTYRMEVILDPTIDSIDPFSTSYWTPESVESSHSKLSSASNKPLIHDELSLLPLKTGKSLVTNIGGTLAFSNPQYPVYSDVHNPTKSKDKETYSKKLLAEEDIENFKAAVAGSDLSKVGLIEVLKRKFPGRPAATIKATLEKFAKRGEKGQREVDKRWTILEPSASFIAD